MSLRSRIPSVLIVFLCSGSGIAGDGSECRVPTFPRAPGATATAPRTSTALLPDVGDAYGQLPLSFEENQGQFDRRVRFLARTPGYRLFLTPDGAVLDVARRIASTASEAVPRRTTPTDGSSEFEYATVRLTFHGANTAPQVIGESPLRHTTSYLIGADPTRHYSGIPNYRQVRFADLYPAIDLVYHADQRQLEYDLVVRPGGDPGRIALVIEGARRIHIDADGDLVLGTAAGEVRQRRPLVYQEVNGERKFVEGGYVLAGAGEVRFALADYDASRTLVIDPMLTYATLLGGSSDDIATALTVDASGNAYVTGYSRSSDFPLASAYDRSVGNFDAFVTKVNPAGTGLVYSTFLGGRNGSDHGLGIAVDATGNAYVTGTTTGSDFPTSTGTYQQGKSGGGSFVAKLGPAGNALVYSTYVLGTQSGGIAVDGAGSAYVTGSATAEFSTTPGAYQHSPAAASGTDAFVLKLNATGTAASYATFLGGSADDRANGIAVDAQRHAYIGGVTSSANFPMASPVQPIGRGGKDGFVAKFSLTGDALVYSTYLGGWLDDTVNAIAVGSAGEVYIAGETYSGDFPNSPDAFQVNKPGGWVLDLDSSVGSAFVTKVAAEGDRLEYSTFLGGLGPCPGYCYLQPPAPRQYRLDAAHGLSVDAEGHAYVTGIARSYGFPLVNSILPEKQSQSDDAIFVTKFSRSGSALLYSTLARTGPGVESRLVSGVPYGAGNSIATDGAGSAYVSGIATSTNRFPTTAGAYETSLQGLADAGILKLSTQPATVALTTSANPVTAGSSLTLRATVTGGASGPVTFMAGSTEWATVPLVGNSAELLIPEVAGAGIELLGAVLRSNGAAADSNWFYQVFDNGGCQ